MLSTKQKSLSIAVMLASGIALQPVVAQAQLEEVVVTAQKRSESLQDTPVAVTAYNEESLETLGVANMADLSVTAPSLQSYDFPTSANNMAIFIRGLGNLDSQTLTTDNPVGIYIDDVYIARTTGALVDLLDLERIEVLRGPQGTLYGRNSSAGAVKFISKKPGTEQAFQVKGTVGNFGLYSVGASADLPVSDTFRTKLSVMSSSVDGWVENEGANSTGGLDAEDFNAKEQSAARLALSWDVSDTVTVDYSFDYTDVDSTPPYFQSLAMGDRREENSELVFTGGKFQYVLKEGDMEQFGHHLTVSADLNDSMTVKSITSYREMRDHVYQNWSDTLFFATELDYSTEAFSQEFQILGSVNEIDYVAGIYYFSEDGEKSETQHAGAPDVLLEPGASTSILLGGTLLGTEDFDTELTSMAVFGQATYPFTDRLSATLGLRYTEDERKATRTGNNISFTTGTNDETFDNTDYTLIVDYVVNDEVNAYAKVATGYRSGGSSERAPNFAQTFDPEEVTSYELGLKSELIDSRLRINAALFRTEIDDAINTIGQGALQETFNFGEVETNGIELDILAAIGEATTIGLNYVYLDGELSDVIVPAASVLQTPGDDITDITFLAQTPDSAYSLTLDHSFMLGELVLDAHIDYSYRDQVYSSARGFRVSDLGRWNGRLSLSEISMGDATVDLGLWVKNLSDEEEVVYLLSGVANQFNTPRTYGLDVKVNF